MDRPPGMATAHVPIPSHHFEIELKHFTIVRISSLHYYIQVPFSCHMIIIYSTFSPTKRVFFSLFDKPW